MPPPPSRSGAAKQTPAAPGGPPLPTNNKRVDRASPEGARDSSAPSRDLGALDLVLDPRCGPRAATHIRCPGVRAPNPSIGTTRQSDVEIIKSSKRTSVPRLPRVSAVGRSGPSPPAAGQELRNPPKQFQPCHGAGPTGFGRREPQRGLVFFGPDPSST